jgi:hypothetical protein
MWTALVTRAGQQRLRASQAGDVEAFGAVAVLADVVAVRVQQLCAKRVKLGVVEAEVLRERAI